jgi:hypothetical protein
LIILGQKKDAVCLYLTDNLLVRASAQSGGQQSNARLRRMHEFAAVEALEQGTAVVDAAAPE